MPILGVIDSAKSGNLGNPAWDSIATYSGGAASSITIGSIPSTYKYLRLVARLKDSRSPVAYSGTLLSFNTTGGTSYGYTYLYGDNRVTGQPVEDSSSAASFVFLSTPGAGTSSSNVYSYTVLDIFDYQNTSKFTSVQGVSTYVDVGGAYLGGQAGVSVSGTWADTSVVSSIILTPTNPNYASNVRVSLYGIKG
jgi:hypothetical protein